MNDQAPMPKERTAVALFPVMPARSLVIAHWAFIGDWSLLIGHSTLDLGPWTLDFGLQTLPFDSIENGDKSCQHDHSAPFSLVGVAGRGAARMESTLRTKQPTRQYVSSTA